MFYNCESLKTLPVISKWKISNAISLKGMFCNCLKLDISKWNTNNIVDMSDIFEGCTLLKSIPDISH